MWIKPCLCPRAIMLLQGKTPLLQALKAEADQAVHLLLDAGADVRYRDRKVRLFGVCFQRLRDLYLRINLLITSPLRCPQSSKEALHFVAVRDYDSAIPIIRRLVAMGARLLSEDEARVRRLCAL